MIAEFRLETDGHAGALRFYNVADPDANAQYGVLISNTRKCCSCPTRGTCEHITAAEQADRDYLNQRSAA